MKFSIPFNPRVFRDFKLFVVPVFIENNQCSLYVPMIVDTAASYVTVRPDLFQELAIVANRNTPLVTASTRTEAPIGQANKVTVGTHCTAPNVQVIAVPLPRSLPAEGLLGASFLSHFHVALDYQQRRFELTTR